MNEDSTWLSLFFSFMLNLHLMKKMLFYVKNVIFYVLSLIVILFHLKMKCLAFTKKYFVHSCFFSHFGVFMHHETGLGIEKCFVHSCFFHLFLHHENKLITILRFNSTVVMHIIRSLVHYVMIIYEFYKLSTFTYVIIDIL